MNELRYKGYAIVMQEIPDEITLALNICGCPYKCEGCHSKFLWDNDGEILNYDELKKLLDKYGQYITCVCFMGGDWNLPALLDLLVLIADYGLKTAIYSGSDEKKTFEALQKLYFDYIKMGSYQAEKGGLDSIKTNQRLYVPVLQFKNGSSFSVKYIDITWKFWKPRL